MVTSLEWATTYLERVCLRLMETGKPKPIGRMADSLLAILASSIGLILLSQPDIRQCLETFLKTDDIEYVLYVFNHNISKMDHTEAVQYINRLNELYKRLDTPTFEPLDPTLYYYI